MGNFIHSNYNNIRIDKKISLVLQEVDIHSLNNLFESAVKTMKKIEEIRQLLSYKWSSLLIKTGCIVLKNPSFDSIIKSITWKLASEYYTVIQDYFKFSVIPPYLTFNNEIESNDEFILIKNTYNEFIEFINERNTNVIPLEKEITSIYFRIKNKLGDRNLYSNMDNNRKKKNESLINTNMNQIFVAITLIKEIKDLCIEIISNMNRYIKKYSDDKYLLSLQTKSNIIRNKKLLTVYDIVMEFTKRQKNKSYQLLIQEYNLIAKVYYSNNYINKPEELNNDEQNPEKPNIYDNHIENIDENNDYDEFNNENEGIINMPNININIPKSNVNKQKFKFFKGKVMKNFIQNILQTTDTVYYNEFDKKEIKARLKELENSKSKAEKEKKELIEKMKSLEKEKTITIFKPVYVNIPKYLPLKTWKLTFIKTEYLKGNIMSRVNVYDMKYLLFILNQGEIYKLNTSTFEIEQIINLKSYSNIISNSYSYSEEELTSITVESLCYLSNKKDIIISINNRLFKIREFDSISIEIEEISKGNYNDDFVYKDNEESKYKIVYLCDGERVILNRKESFYFLDINNDLIIEKIDLKLNCEYLVYSKVYNILVAASVIEGSVVLYDILKKNIFSIINFTEKISYIDVFNNRTEDILVIVTYSQQDNLTSSDFYIYDFNNKELNLKINLNNKICHVEYCYDNKTYIVTDSESRFYFINSETKIIKEIASFSNEDNEEEEGKCSSLYLGDVNSTIVLFNGKNRIDIWKGI